MIVNKDGEYVGGLELKCPLPHTHIGYMRYPADLLKKYKIQVHASLLVSGLKNWKLMSYFPGLDPVIIDVVPDETTDKLRDVLEIFWKNWDIAKELLEGKGIDFNPVRKPIPEPQYEISEEDATEDLGFLPAEEQ